jgi:TP901 family phage tail tape measure protein
MANTPLTITLRLSPELDIGKINVLLRALKTSMGSLGKDIQLLDANKINAELSKINTSTQSVGSGLASAKTQADGLKASLGAAANMKGLIGQAFGLNQMSMGLGALNTAIGGFIEPFKELDKNVKDIGTLGRENFEEFAGMASELSTRIPESAAGIARGVYQAVSASMQGSNQEILDFVEVAANAATAGLSDTETAVNGFTSVINAYGMKTSQASDVSNMFFAAVKLGKTTFSEMNAALASYLPTAGALGVSFDQTTAAIVELTKQGTPTAMAGTQINAALLAIVKGNKYMIEGLKKSGMTLKDLQENLKKPIAEGGGLVNTLRMIKVASEKSGVALTKMTGRAEGMKIIETMVGTEEKYNEAIKTQNKIQEERAADVAKTAFEIAKTSLAASTFGNKMDAVMHKVFETVGSGAVRGLGMMNKLLPAIMGFSILGPVFMKMAAPVGVFANTLVQRLIPSLFATAAAEKGVEVGALGGAQAFKILAKAMFTTPIGLLLTGITAAIAAYALLHKSSMDIAQGHLSEAKATEELVKKKVDLNSKQQTLASSNLKLAQEYETLGNISKRTQEEQSRFLELHGKLASSYPGVLGPAEKFTENQKALRDAMGTSNMEVEKSTVANAKLISRYEELGNKANKTTEETLEFKNIQGKLNGIFPDVIGHTKDWATELNTLKQKAGMTSGELLKLQEQMKGLNKEMQEATSTRLSSEIEVARNKIGQLLSPGTIGKITDFVVGGLSLGFLKSIEGAELDKIKAGITKFNTEVGKAWSIESLEQQSAKLQLMFFGNKKEIESYFGPGTVDLIKNFRTQSADILNKIVEEENHIIELRKKKLATAGKIKIEEATKTPPPIDLGDEDVADVTNAETEAKKTAYELAKQKYDLDLKALDQKYRKIKADQDEKIALEKRERTTQDDIDLGLQKVEIDKEKIKLAEQLQKVNLSDMKKKEGGKEVLDADKVKKTKQEIENIVTDLNIELKEDETKQITLGTKLEKDNAKLLEDIKNLKKEVEEKEIAVLKLKLEMTSDPAEIESLIKKLKEAYQKQLSEVNQDIEEQKIKISILPNSTPEEEQKYVESLKVLKDYEQNRAEIEKNITETGEKETGKRKAILNEELERYKEYGLEITDALAETGVNIIKNREAFGRELLIAFIDIVEKELLVAQIEALGTALGAAVIDPTAIFKALGYIAAIKVAALGLKAIAGAETGERFVGRQSRQKRGRTDTILRWLAPDERVIPARLNKKYSPYYDYIEAGGDPEILFRAMSFASGSPLLSTPTNAVIGDNPRFSEAVMLEPQIAEVGAIGANMAVSAMNKTMNALLGKMDEQTKAIREMETRFYVLERDIGEGVDKYQTKRKNRIRT